jgi:hypothetical protein
MPLLSKTAYFQGFIRHFSLFLCHQHHQQGDVPLPYAGYAQMSSKK